MHKENYNFYVFLNNLLGDNGVGIAAPEFSRSTNEDRVLVKTKIPALKVRIKLKEVIAKFKVIRQIKVFNSVSFI